VAGAGSGAGKTLTTLVLLSGLISRGHEVHPFKCGPDFIDPRYHEWMAGRPSFSLDLHFSQPSDLRSRYDRLVASSSGGVVEGVMGLYDGVDRGTSTYDIVRILDLPVLLVLNAQGMAETLAALVRGLSEFRRGIRILGVIATRTGSDRHRRMIERALSSEGLPPLLGVLPRRESLGLPERHLGLVGPGSLDPDGERAFGDAIGEVARDFDWAGIDSAFCPVSSLHSDKSPADKERGERSAFPGPAFSDRAKERIRRLTGGGEPSPPVKAGTALRLGVAMDEAFWFYYPENWEVFKRHGITFEFFSPLSDPALPPGIDGLYLGGGYPELYAGKLSDNRSLLAEIRAFCHDGRPVYAECGGMLYLTRGLAGKRREGTSKTSDEREGEDASLDDGPALAGLIPVRFAMGERSRRLGYAEVLPAGPGLFGMASGPVRGHLFHYSTLLPEGEPESGSVAGENFGPAFRHQGSDTLEGFARGFLVASYLHLYFPSNESYAQSLALAMKGSR
jgi:cobyrinic acid a,c-diamide synthase